MAAQPAPTIHELSQELIGVVSALPEFQNRGFSVFDLDDMAEIVQHEYLPLVGITYEGRTPVGDAAQGKTSTARTATMTQVNFSILIAVRYGSAIGIDDTKVDAVNLLDATNRAVLGYKGVNYRGWVFNGESPLPSEIEGVIFYGQSWSIRLPVVGNFGT